MSLVFHTPHVPRNRRFFVSAAFSLSPKLSDRSDLSDLSDRAVIMPDPPAYASAYFIFRHFARTVRYAQLKVPVPMLWNSALLTLSYMHGTSFQSMTGMKSPTTVFPS